MASDEITKLMADLRAWADQEYGRHAELARTLGVSRSVISDWLGGRSKPTLEKSLQLMEFLKTYK
jgi:predicted transcriptional regulator